MFLQGRELQHNVSAGVILSDQSLVLQGVTRLSAGDYACMAANGEGKGTSNLVALNVMCEYMVHFFFLLFFLFFIFYFKVV